MIVAGIYSFKNGREIIERDYPEILGEVYRIIGAINSDEHKTKESAQFFTTWTSSTQVSKLFR